MGSTSSAMGARVAGARLIENSARRWNGHRVQCSGPNGSEDVLARKWWHPHVESALQLDESRSEAHASSTQVHVALELSRQAAIDLLAFLDLLGNTDFKRVTDKLSEERAHAANQALSELADELQLALRPHGEDGAPRA